MKIGKQTNAFFCFVFVFSCRGGSLLFVVCLGPPMYRPGVLCSKSGGWPTTSSGAEMLAVHYPDRQLLHTI